MDIDSCALFEALADDLAGFPSAFSSAEPWPGMTLKEFRVWSLKHNLLRKLKVNVSADADEKALSKFLSSNLACRDWTLRLTTSLDELLVGHFRKMVERVVHPGGDVLVDHVHDLFDRARVGPGSSRGARSTDLYGKLFASPLTSSSRWLYEEYERWIKADPHGLNAELNRTEVYGDCTIVEGSRISFVPKDSTISRTICVEPTLNIFAQLGLEQVLLERLQKLWKIDLKDQQDVNRELACRGSRDDSLATIDLSSASDSISLKMLEEFFPSDFLNWLRVLRSPFVEIDGEQHELFMVSSMGNGSTFPLETIIFTCVVAAVYDLLDIPVKARSKCVDRINMGVFGDDIICLAEASRWVIRLLDILGFSVNKQKTFIEGPFRESCGGDYFRGHPVRPVFLKDLSNQGSRYSAINNLNEWSAVSGIPLTHTVGLLLRTVRFLEVPMDESKDSGIRVPFDQVTRRVVNSNGSFIYQRYVPISLKYKIGDRIRPPKGARTLIYNPSGLFLAFLRGTIVSGSIAVRLDDVRYRAKQRVTHNWDWPGSDSVLRSRVGGRVEWRQLATAIYLNLLGR